MWRINEEAKDLWMRNPETVFNMQFLEFGEFLKEVLEYRHVQIWRFLGSSRRRYPLPRTRLAPLRLRLTLRVSEVRCSPRRSTQLHRTHIRLVGGSSKVRAESAWISVSKFACDMLRFCPWIWTS